VRIDLDSPSPPSFSVFSPNPPSLSGGFSFVSAKHFESSLGVNNMKQGVVLSSALSWSGFKRAASSAFLPLFFHGLFLNALDRLRTGPAPGLNPPILFILLSQAWVLRFLFFPLALTLLFRLAELSADFLRGTLNVSLPCPRLESDSPFF